MHDREQGRFDLTRRAVMAAGAAGWIGAGAAQAQGAATAVRLKADGSERDLPARWLGHNSPANYDIPVELAAFREAVKAARPHLLRFPGGTVANYYQPETGQLDFGDFPNGSIYRKYLQSQALPRSRRLHPKGVSIEQYIDLTREMDAELIVLPNLETSSLESQAAWFRRMNAHGFTPDILEMGNEFYLALLMDPVTLEIFPDWKTTLARTKAYLDAIRPHIARDARVAVQAASAKFHIPYGDTASARHRHEERWDHDMAPEPWFHAVTAHLYPTIEGSAGAGSLAGLPGNLEKVFRAFMARTDSGFDRSIADTVGRMPGKEVWITEWGAFEPAGTFSGAQVNFDGMWLHMVTRGLLAQLRHKEVTISTHHALFASGNLMSAFTRDGERFVPINATGVIQWFADASRGPDAHYQAVTVEGSRRIAGESTVPGETFRDVDAALLRVGRARTLFVHNAGPSPVQVDAAALVGANVSADVIETPDLLASLQSGVPTPKALPPDARLVAPAYSLARLRWTA